MYGGSTGFFNYLQKLIQADRAAVRSCQNVEGRARCEGVYVWPASSFLRPLAMLGLVRSFVVDMDESFHGERGQLRRR
jgi:hypothetical protein